MVQMFFFAASFNQDVSGWDIANVVDAREMFAFARSFQCHFRALLSHGLRGRRVVAER